MILNPRPALEALGISIMVEVLVACGLFIMWAVTGGGPTLQEQQQAAYKIKHGLR